jgi:hypothetical protein
MKNQTTSGIYRDIAILCGISILIEFLVYIATPFIFHSFVDQWGFKVYFETIVIPFATNGSLPYVNYFWEYPILMVVPVFIAAIPVFLTNNPYAFFVAFPILMTICNLVVVALVYILTLKIYRNKKRAFIAGFLYATAITAAYITLTNFDPMPTMLMMLGLTCTIYGTDKLKSAGYLAYILGFFTKIYPVAILPFLVLFNAKKSSLKEEIVSVVIVGIIPFLILFVSIYLINPAMIDTYIIKNAASKEMFVSSFVYTMYGWLHFIIGLPVAETLVANIMSVVLAGIILFLLYLAYMNPEQDAIFLLHLTLITLVAVIACSKYHSPQYMLWFMPILCILIAGDLTKMGIFYLIQIIWYIKFPLTFWSLWTNAYYTQPLPTAGGITALVFFTIEYAVLFYLVWKVSLSEWEWFIPMRAGRKT